MPEPIAYFLTWTTYGTWLHGDERGSVDDRHNVPGTPFAPANPRRLAYRAAQLKHPPFTLDESARGVVHATIVVHCDIRGWGIRALNVRSNHVHIVVSCGGVDPERVVGQLKAWTTRRLREAGMLGSGSAWVEGSSKQALYHDENVSRAIAYVMEGQGPELA
jgi:REP element-mobilizing transposase RayT